MAGQFKRCGWLGRWALLAALVCGCGVVLATTAPPADDILEFDDQPLDEPLGYPDWFKLSFLDLGDDIREAVADGKRGLMVYVGQKYCPYCKTLLETNFGKHDILEYTQRHFDVIGIDIHGGRGVTDVDGAEGSERSFALRHGVDFTPTLLFYDSTGKEVFRLAGYYPPYQFRAALEYVADAHYRQENFRSYLERAVGAMVFDNEDMNPENFFLPPPYALARTHHAGERPLVVFFEQPDCHACDILHTGPLTEPEILARLGQFESVQLNLWGKTPVITPDGRRTTEGAWAEQLGLFYAPTLLFFDLNGREILRVDSVVQFYRLRNVLDYIASGAYKEFPTFQRWRETQGDAVH
ncbi:MAG: thioredoxin fold domain-containing protein [Gammaproteobacteria bacterium]|nr:thioredoxin fold domain-containing protein [Gammaproteobacteria bacterium]